MTLKRKPVLSVVVIVLIAGLAAFGYYNTVGYWGRLDSAVELLGDPAGLKRVGERKEGTTFCIITCSKTEAAIVVEYLGDSLSLDEMCTSVGSAATTHFPAVTVAQPYSD